MYQSVLLPRHTAAFNAYIKHKIGRPITQNNMDEEYRLGRLNSSTRSVIRGQGLQGNEMSKISLLVHDELASRLSSAINKQNFIEENFTIVPESGNPMLKTAIHVSFKLLRNDAGTFMVDQAVVELKQIIRNTITAKKYRIEELGKVVFKKANGKTSPFEFNTIITSKNANIDKSRLLHIYEAIMRSISTILLNFNENVIKEKTFTQVQTPIDHRMHQYTPSLPRAPTSFRHANY